MTTPQEVKILKQIYEKNQRRNLIRMERYYAVLYDKAKSLIEFPLLIEKEHVFESESPPSQREYQGINALPDCIIATKEALSVANFEKWLAQDGAATYADFKQVPQAWMGAPLLAGDGAIGAIVVESNTISAYDPSEEQLLMTMAGQVAVALENARAYRRLHELNTKIAQTEEIITRFAIASDFLHRINNLAGTIPIWVQLIRQELLPSDPRDERVVQYLDEIDKEIKDLLDSAAGLMKRPIQEEEIDVKLLLESIIGQVKIQYPNITCHQSLAPDLYLVEANYFQISSAIDSLITNALESMPSGGTLTVNASSSVDASEKRWIQIQITDTGSGILEDEIANIFEPFFTTKGPGRGYGLWRSRSYVEGMGGTLNLTSKVDVGTTVDIMLPAI